MCSFINRTGALALVFAALASTFASQSATAAIVTGTFSSRVSPLSGAYSPVFGDGVNSVQMFSTFGSYTPTIRGLLFAGRFAGTIDPVPGDEFINSDIAFAPNVLNPSDLADASTYTYRTDFLDDYVMATDFASDPNNGHNPNVLPGLILYRNYTTGHYGAVRLDTVYGWQGSFVFGVQADFTYWFQTDGTGNFSVAPEPTSIALLPIALTFMGRKNRR